MSSSLTNGLCAEPYVLFRHKRGGCLIHQMPVLDALDPRIDGSLDLSRREGSVFRSAAASTPARNSGSLYINIRTPQRPVMQACPSRPMTLLRTKGPSACQGRRERQGLSAGKQPLTPAQY